MPHVDTVIPHADTTPHTDIAHTDTKTHSDAPKRHEDVIRHVDIRPPHTDTIIGGRHTDTLPQ